MKKILIVSFSRIDSDPRVMRQIRLLESDYDLTVIGFGQSPNAKIKYKEVTKVATGIFTKLLWVIWLLLGAFDTYYWARTYIRQAFKFMKDQSFDLIIANDLQALPVCLDASHGRPVIFDAHEYAPKEHDDQLIWRVLFGRFNHVISQKYIPLVSSMLTVCKGIGDVFFQNYGVRPLIVHNAPTFQNLEPSPVDDNLIRMIHHGIASSARKLELMIEVMSYLDDRFRLDLMLVESEPSYLTYLRGKAKGDSRIRFVEPVEMVKICENINVYDVGVFLLPDESFNYKHALPNKFFEFIQARLGIAVGPSSEMAALVKEYECGVVSDSFDPKNFANSLSKLNKEKIIAMKHASHYAAEKLCFEDGAVLIKEEIAKLLNLDSK